METFGTKTKGERTVTRIGNKPVNLRFQNLEVVNLFVQKHLGNF